MKKAIIWATLLAGATAWTIIGKPVPASAATHHNGRMVVKVAHHKAKLYWKGTKVATYKFARKPKVKFVTPDGLTYKKLTHRKGRIVYVEVCVGKVLDNKGNGKILNTRSKYNYISYRRLPYKKGTKVRTYLVYNPYNNHEDGIVERFDEKMS